MIDELTDDFEIFMQECKEGKYKLKINDIFTRANSNNNNIYDNNVIKNINYLFSFFPSKDYHLVTECAKIIIDLYENAKMSKYNSAIQKLFIQLKEIKIEAILEQPREISNEFQPSKNEEINRSYKNEEESDEDINMIIID